MKKFLISLLVFIFAIPCIILYLLLHITIIPFKLINCGRNDVYTWIMHLEDFAIKLHKNLLT